jgi:hypothetical protein
MRPCVGKTAYLRHLASDEVLTNNATITKMQGSRMLAGYVQTNGEYISRDWKKGLSYFKARSVFTFESMNCITFQT